MSTYIRYCFTISILALVLACGTSRKINHDYVYFNRGADTVNAQQQETTIRPNDILSIQVASKTLNQEQASIFNLPNSNGAAQGYRVSQSGLIEFPVIGSVNASGLTREQLQQQLAQKLTDYVKNPSVLVRLLEFKVNVLGEVRLPGTKKFTEDRVSIIDALSAAGDLTDFGKRDDVTIIREENGKQIFHKVDLRNKDIFESPVYILQPNDVVYVGPNKNKLKNLSVDPEAQRRTSLIFSIVGVVISIGTLFIFASN
ncbi:hypothetical protein EXU57_14950 [Segetibacter sp. 3557_3]|uniref:polysaccharide biosynthesis/export family protein n=1 Tax=Segetibacter sp. 3557_3 TaxID=2547429 RepID=UPI00105912B3|nr:polysaccharide biosynthesis/export family protein [Segetibacter sp. 3557_3]TDH24632.1 hypothetical protein EXU57_14950 [Segetibacter sp. 3557_3]